MSQLLVVCHCPSPNVTRLCDAAVEGARAGADGAFEVRFCAPLEATPQDVLDSNGILLGTTENFGYMSGALKDFFERIYYPCLEATQGRPYALFVKGGQDGTGARDSVERIVTGLRWRAAGEPLVMTGAMQPGWPDRCHELGMTLAAGIAAGIF
ncbi:MAG: flavodoxin family protein [Pseudomonadota bacterium]